MRKLRSELQKVQELNRQSEEELHKYESRYQELSAKLTQANDKHRASLQEIAMREEQIVVLKVELASMQEKFRHRKEEVSHLDKSSLTSLFPFFFHLPSLFSL